MFRIISFNDNSIAAVHKSWIGKEGEVMLSKSWKNIQGCLCHLFFLNQGAGSIFFIGGYVSYEYISNFYLQKTNVVIKVGKTLFLVYKKPCF